MRSMISEVLDELISVARAQGCSFPHDFKQRTIDEMARANESSSIMYQDYSAKRPMEVETYLGSPIKLAQEVGLRVPRIETLYAILHNLNIVNQQRKESTGIMGNGMPPPVRLSSAPPARPGVNFNGQGQGRGRGSRSSSMNGPPPNMRGGPANRGSGPNGYPRPMTGGNGYPPRNLSRRGSMDGDLGEEFSHLVLYDDIPESGESNYGGDGSDLGLRERELMLRQREIALREQELRMRRGGPPPSAGGRRGPQPRRKPNFDDDDDDDDYYVDPQDGPPPPQIDPDNFDMMSVTSRRNRKAPSASQLRQNPEFDTGRKGNGFMGRPGPGRNRSSARLISQVPGLHDSIMDDPMMGYSSNRYGTVDRQTMGTQSRTNSLTAARLDELQYGGAGLQGPQGPYPRRASQSPGNAYSPQAARGGRPSPPNGFGGPTNGRPSPPNAMRQPVPRHPPGQGNSVAPQQVENYAGVSLHPPKGPMNVRSLTGSASASAGSGESANFESEPSAHSSQSSLGPRPPIGVR